MTASQWKEILEAQRQLQGINKAFLASGARHGVENALNAINRVVTEQNKLDDEAIDAELPATDYDLYLEPIGQDD